ncbi:hypothetical protein SAMN05216359_11942 [Roseateles sp. YR242]|uniref:CC0125/CC1285 family lipoprotein n=1 Tax=Roseateles sp. YR242 TaxID=1855305 RepID=UPI0008C3734C|nr:hypothetical protein [Roseateles sp. YR242]SEL84431.1 hypothetical protein SAMN05216359_11942 [Roseateles sp. YR242]
MKKLIAMCSAVLLGGCMLGPYSKLLAGHGYTDVRLAPDVFRVTFLGGGLDVGPRIDDLVLLRSAEVTLAHGYSYFVVTSEERETRVGSYDEPGVSTTTEVVTRKKDGEREATSSTTATAAKTTEVKLPRVMQLIRCYTDAPKDAGGRVIHDARAVWATVGARYGVKRAPER